MMSVMTAVETWPEVWPHEDRPLTVADLERMPDDGSRYELDEGMLVVSPIAFNNHQFVVWRLCLVLESARPPEFFVLPGPGINLSKFNHRVPDVAVVRAEGFVVDFVFETRPPLLAVEVASRSTKRYDRTRKKAVYAEFGIPSYWIITPGPGTPDITAYELVGDQYEQVTYAAGDEKFTTAVPFPVSFTPALLSSTQPLR
jgi:Uma2 family endonuclease